MVGKYVVGVDYGSDSVRALVVDTASGEALGSGVAYYPRWKKGLYQHPERAVFRQHPLDYLEALEKCVREATGSLTPEQKEKIAGIGVDTTGSTPAPVNADGVPLALLPEFSGCEDAMFHLWKDHSSMREAEEVDRMFRRGSDIDYSIYQGTYSAEWFWAKILRTVRGNAEIRNAAFTWMEHCDWIVGTLCGNTDPRKCYHSACAAGHKAFWHSRWKGLPARELLVKLDPYLGTVYDHYGNSPRPAVVKAGQLTSEWAEKLGLPEGIAVSGSSFDAHAGAVGAGIREKTMVCTLGTSAVDMVVVKAEDLRGKDIRRFGGQAEDSILPGYVGIETGQAAFGDIFAWFKRVLLWPVQEMRACLPEEDYRRIYKQMDGQILPRLQEEAAKLPMEPFPVALDWFNGRRYPDTDDFQKAVIGNLSLGTSAPEMCRALIFGAVCGLRRIIDGLEGQGVLIENLIAVGGISKKSEYVMQMMADTLGKEISILDADQTCALGAAVYAAMAAGVYGNVDQATEHMAARRIRAFSPDLGKHADYDRHYQEYLKLAEAAENFRGKN